MNKEAFDFLLFKVGADDDKQPKNKKKDDDKKPKSKKDGDKPKAKPPKSNEIVNMDTPGGRVADLLSPHAFGGDRAGRSQAMAIAAGRDPSFGVRHPFSQTLGHTTFGSFAGGGLGALLGAGVGAGAGAAGLLSKGHHSPAGMGAIVGTGVGTTAGALLGMLTSTLSRRSDMRATNQAYDAANANGTLNVWPPKLSPLAAALLPLRGPHRRGQMQGYKTMSGDPTAQPLHNSSAAKYIAEHIPHVATPASVIGGYGQNISTQFEARKARRDQQTKEAGVSEFYAKYRPQIAEAINKTRATVMPHFTSKSLMDYLKTPTAQGAVAGGLLGAGYGFARQKGPEESAVGNAIRAGLVGAAGGGLAANTFAEPKPLINWRDKLRPIGGGPVELSDPNNPMNQQIQNNDRLGEIHDAYDGYNAYDAE